MEKIIQEIFETELGEVVLAINEIIGLGSVNRVFDVSGNQGDYIIRLYESLDKRLEYEKEKWCIEQVAGLGVPSPQVLSMGFRQETLFMIQGKIPGISGQACERIEKDKIWNALGRYAARFQQISRIENRAIEAKEFHKDWKARLRYNLNELNEEDSLRRNKVLSEAEQNQAKEALMQLENKDFQVGLVHGDLCPRNIIWSSGVVYLLDWGTAEINVVPHIEIGTVLMSKQADPKAFQSFLDGLGISSLRYESMEAEIHCFNLLHHLDKYRWAEGHHVENIKDYENNIRETFDRIYNNDSSK